MSQGSRKSGILVTGLRANLEFRSQFAVRPEAEQKFRISEPICGWALDLRPSNNLEFRSQNVLRDISKHLIHNLNSY